MTQLTLAELHVQDAEIMKATSPLENPFGVIVTFWPLFSCAVTGALQIAAILPLLSTCDRSNA